MRRIVFFFFFLTALLLTVPSYAGVLKGFVQSPKGSYKNYTIAGWACESQNSEPVTITVYAQDENGQETRLGSTTSGRTSEQGVKNACATDGHHRFAYAFSQKDVFNHQGKKIVLKASTLSSVVNIYGRQSYYLPEHPASYLRGYTDGIKTTNGRHFLMGWACQTNVEEPLSLSLRIKREDGSFVNIDNYGTADVIAEPAIANICGTNLAKHRYRMPISDAILSEYPGRELYVVAKQQLGSYERALGSSRVLRVPSNTPVEKQTKPNVIVFFTDDQGYADLGIHQVLDDIKTPNIDQLAMNGTRFTNGYITAPQCSPSRAAMITGRYQQRFGMDENHYIPMTTEVETLATKFKGQGYRTGIVGKWHLEIMDNSKTWASQNFPDIVPFKAAQVPLETRLDYFPARRGFDDMFVGYTGSYFRNFDWNGRALDIQSYTNNSFRVDLTTDASLTFIDRHWQTPFYLHVSPYAPHVPMEATQQYLDRVPKDMPTRRRYALAMMLAIDDGVGKVVEKLKRYNLLDNTLIFFISDNGAPLGDDMTDAHISVAREQWNGSRNDPFTGEKGMLTEGALRVPFIAHWPDKIPSGLVLDTPVSSLDAAYTALYAAGATELEDLDGADLLPAINGDPGYLEQRPMFWRFYNQRAVRKGDWKYMQAGIAREYLFDMTQPEPESTNLINTYPEIAEELRTIYWQWADNMLLEEPLVEIPQPFAERVDRYLPPPSP